MVGGGSGDPLKHRDECAGFGGSAEQGGGIVFARAVAVELEEDVVADAGREGEPAFDAVGSGRVVAGEFAGFNAGKQAAAVAEAGGAGDHEEVASRSATDSRFDAAVEAAWAVGVAGGPVDLVNDAGLGGRRKRGHCEVGVAAEVAKELEFARNAAAATVGTGVVERPVAVDEAEDEAAVVVVE